MVKYEIRSRIKPDLVIMRVTCDDFEYSKRKQLYYLSHSIHPEATMQNHLLKFGIMDFEFIIIEQAIIIPEVETRRGRSAKVEK